MKKSLLLISLFLLFSLSAVSQKWSNNNYGSSIEGVWDETVFPSCIPKIDGVKPEV